MGYRKIVNLQLDHPLFLFKEVYALEKIHGTSTHLSFRRGADGAWQVSVFAGGLNHAAFLFMLNVKYGLSTTVLAKLTELSQDLACDQITIYGEGYGGKCQRMADVYGQETDFIAFEVFKIVDGRECWLSVPRAASFVAQLGLPFVYYELGSATLEWLDLQRNRDSEQAKRNGLGDGKESEGVVVRAPIELYDDHGGRLIAKFKREKFRETATAQMLAPEQIEVLHDAEKIAEEWVVEERLNHVLSALAAKGYANLQLRDTRLVIEAMSEDVALEAVGKVSWSEAVSKAIGRRTAVLFKRRVMSGGVINPVMGTTAQEVST